MVPHSTNNKWWKAGYIIHTIYELGFIHRFKRQRSNSITAMFTHRFTSLIYRKTNTGWQVSMPKKYFVIVLSIFKERCFRFFIQVLSTALWFKISLSTSFGCLCLWLDQNIFTLLCWLNHNISSIDHMLLNWIELYRIVATFAISSNIGLLP